MTRIPHSDIPQQASEKGSILLHLVVLLVAAGIIGTAMVAFMSTSVNQQVFTNTAVQADLLAESGFRRVSAVYKAAPTEIDKNTVLKTLHGRTFVLNGGEERFSLDIRPYFYTARSAHAAGAVRIRAEYPGARPSGVNPPASGTLGILSGSRFTLYTYVSLSGDAAAFAFEGIAKVADGSPGLASPLDAGATVQAVLTCTPTVLTGGIGNSLTVMDANRLMPDEDGVFSIITRSGEFRDAAGTRTGIYTYQTRTGTTLSDIRVFNDPDEAFSLTLDADSRIVVHRSARFASTGTVHAGSELEANRVFSVMAGLGDTLFTVSATDLIYDHPDNVLTGLIDGAQVLGDADMVSPGKVGDAMAFDGDMDYVRLSDDPALDLSGEGSIGAWVKATAFTNRSAGIIRKGGLRGDSDLAYVLQFRPPDRIRFEIHASETTSLSLESTSRLTEGLWYHVAATWGPAGMFIYIDGIEDVSRPETLTVRNTEGTVQIGAQLDELFNSAQKNFGFHGLIDEVFIYNTQEDLCGIREIFANACNVGCDAVAFYPFAGNYRDGAGEDKEGDRANDASGSGPGLTADHHGCSNRAVYFRYNDYLNIGAEAPFDFTGPFTVSAWVRVDSWSWIMGNDSFVAKGSDSFRLRRYGTSNNATFGTTGLNPVDTAGNDPIRDGSWHHLVGVYTGSRKILYVDGAVDAARNVSGTLRLNNDQVRLGPTAFFFLSFFEVAMDDVGFWDRALSEDEVDHIYRGLRTDRSLP
ncbi:hypothetical protein JCM14469_06750 [Desulfatiferula olefinivorans]